MRTSITAQPSTMLGEACDSGIELPSAVMYAIRLYASSSVNICCTVSNVRLPPRYLFCFVTPSTVNRDLPTAPASESPQPRIVASVLLPHCASDSTTSGFRREGPSRREVSLPTQSTSASATGRLSGNTCMHVYDTNMGDGNWHWSRYPNSVCEPSVVPPYGTCACSELNRLMIILNLAAFKSRGHAYGAGAVGHCVQVSAARIDKLPVRTVNRRREPPS